MDFKYSLLSAAVAASLLTACGGSSKNSSPKAPETPETPVQAPVVLTDEQKQAIGKAFVAGLSQKVSTLSTQSAGMVKGFLDATNSVDQAENPGEFEIKQGLNVFFQVIGPVRQEAYNAIQKIEYSEPESESASYGDAIELSFSDTFENDNGQEETIALEGTVTVTQAANGADIFTFDAEFIVTIEEEPDFVSDLQLVVTENLSDYTPTVAGDPADTDYQLSVSGTLTNADMNMTLTNAAFSSIYDDGDDESEANHSAPGAMKQVSFNIEKVAIVTPELTAEAEVDALFEQPLQTEDGEYFYSGFNFETGDTLGSLGVMASGSENSPINPFTPIAGMIRSFTPMLSRGPSGPGFFPSPEQSLNISNISLKNFKVSLTGSADYLSLEDVSFTGNDPLYTADVDGYGGLATYEYNEAHTQLVIENSLGTATYSFELNASEAPANSDIPAPPPIPTGTVTCVQDVKSKSVEQYVGFSGYYGGCLDIYMPSATSLDAFAERYNIEMMIPSQQGSSIPVRLEANTASENIDKGIVVPQYPVMPHPDSLAAPVDYTVSATGALSADGTVTPFSMQLQHPASLDYQLTAQLGEAPAAMTATWATLNPNFELKTSIDYLGHAFDASFNFDMDKVPGIFSEPSEEESDALEQQVEAKGYASVTAGEVTIDGLVVANIEFHTEIPIKDGFGIIQENNPFALPPVLPSPPISMAVSINFLDGTTPTGPLFADVAEFSTTQNTIDCEVEEEEVPNSESEMLPLEAEECTEEVTHSLNGILDLNSLTDAFLGELAPYLSFEGGPEGPGAP